MCMVQMGLQLFYAVVDSRAAVWHGQVQEWTPMDFAFLGEPGQPVVLLYAQQ